MIAGGTQAQEFCDILRSKHPVLGQMPSVLESCRGWGITVGFNHEQKNAQLSFGFSVFAVKA